MTAASRARVLHLRWQVHLRSYRKASCLEVSSSHPRRARALDVPEEWTHEILRRAHVAELDALTRMSFETPEELRAMLIEGMRAQLPEGYDVDKHFNPRYRPWQQRIAMLPDGDMFTAMLTSSGHFAAVAQAW